MIYTILTKLQLGVIVDVCGGAFVKSCSALLLQITEPKMKAEFKKVLHLFEELEDAGECATLTISSRKGISTIKLVLQSSPPPPKTDTNPTSPALGGRRCRQSKVKQRKHAAEHQAALMTARPKSPPPPDPAFSLFLPFFNHGAPPPHRKIPSEDI